jgi:plasmid maintenance system antidote protein VapI
MTRRIAIKVQLPWPVPLARYFGGTAQFWLNLQSIYDLRTAERPAETKRALRGLNPLEHSAA